MGIENTTLRKIILVRGWYRARAGKAQGGVYKKSWVSVRDDDAGILVIFFVFFLRQSPPRMPVALYGQADSELF